ncbi:MAG: hypothetical protein M2R45_00760 [Verrucomicrobia subdivision 3 bacterium]|nr:hypothetical protein [Limisphaerales bacterium]MCS1413134.1 hypothetical protein [Limisphaerales bacterium]
MLVPGKEYIHSNIEKGKWNSHRCSRIRNHCFHVTLQLGRSLIPPLRLFLDHSDDRFINAHIPATF